MFSVLLSILALELGILLPPPASSLWIPPEKSKPPINGNLGIIPDPLQSVFAVKDVEQSALRSALLSQGADDKENVE